MHTCTHRKPAPKELFVRIITSGAWETGLTRIDHCEHHSIAAASLQADDITTHLCSCVHTYMAQSSRLSFPSSSLVPV
jgi:hypothetical protein